MTRLTVMAAICLFMWVPAAVAKTVSESTVEKACGSSIQGGCVGNTCATGCEKMEGGKLYSYGCTFPNKTGKTKATCSKTAITRTAPGGSRNSVVGKKPSRLKAN